MGLPIDTRKREVMDSVFVDESGYTGADLLNADQVFQAAAAVRQSEARAEEIVEEYFSTVQAPELKLSSLVRRPRYRKAIIGALQAVAEDLGAVSYVFCKRYALWLQLLDDCVEPVCHRLGAPFYENGWNRSFASLLFFTSATFWGAARTERILAAYQRASRSKSPEDVKALIEALRSIKGCDCAEFFVPAMNADSDVIESLLHPDSTIDISYALVTGLVSWMEERTESPYRIVHDNNKAIGEKLDKLAALSEIEQSRGFEVSSVTRTHFPLRFSGADMADSRDDRRLQLADLFAGSLRLSAEMLRGIKPNDGLPDELLGSLPDESIIFNLPTLNFNETRAMFHGTDAGEMIDFLAHEFAKRDLRKESD